MEETQSPIQNPPSLQINEQIIRERIEALKLEQNLVLGIIGGTIAGVFGAALWAIITYVTEFQIGWMSVGVAFLVGFCVRSLGKGIDKSFGVAGAVIALVSIALGNFLASIGFLAKYFEVGFVEMLITFNYAMTFDLMKETFSFMDIFFYGIAVYEGYRFSFRKITREQLLQGAVFQQE